MLNPKACFDLTSWSSSCVGNSHACQLSASAMDLNGSRRNAVCVGVGEGLARCHRHHGTIPKYEHPELTGAEPRILGFVWFQKTGVPTRGIKIPSPPNILFARATDAQCVQHETYRGTVLLLVSMGLQPSLRRVDDALV